ANGGAGGTGYPFGTSGLTWCSPSSTPAGGNGGGSDGQDRFGGGGGAFSANAGSGEAPNGGQQYGSPELVPLCGGSGGAAGNPQASFVTSGCSGDGGGGGGAVLLYSRAGIFISGSLLANGANGGPVSGSSVNGGGGGGAGGGIILSSNGGIVIPGVVNAIKGKGTAGSNGGSNGGDGSDGRIRVDDLTSVGGTILPAISYSGPTLDTVAPTKSFIIPFKGTVSNNNGGSVSVYVQRMDGSYQNGGNPYNTSVNNGQFLQPVTLDSASGSDLFFITAIRTDGTMPVMSEASALLMKYATCPNPIPASLSFPTLSTCTPATETLRDTINLVTDTLLLRIAHGTSAFLLATDTLLPGNIYYVKVSFAPTAAGIYIDTLVIHDLNSSSACPDARVPLYGISDSINVQQSTKVLNFGTLKLDSAAILWDTITNRSKTVPITITRIYWVPPDPRISIASPAFIVGKTLQTSPPLDSISIEFQFYGQVPADSTPYNGKLIVVYSDSLCPIDSVTVPMTAKMVVPVVTTSPDTLNFGVNASCHDSIKTVTFTNTGNATYHINSVQIRNSAANMAFTLLTPTTPDSIVQGNSKQYTVKFHPLSPDGVKKDSFEIVSNDRPNDLITIYLIGTRVSASYVISPANVLLGKVNVGSTRADTVVIRDTGTANLCVTSVSIAAPFTLTGTAQKMLTPNDTMQVIVSFTPGAKDTSTYNGTLKVIMDCPCTDTALIAVQAAGANGVPNYSPTNLDFGNVLKCLSKTDTIKIWNDGNAPITIDSIIRPLSGDGPLFTVVQAPANGHILNPGDTVIVIITYNGSTSGNIAAKFGELYLYTSFNGISTLTKIPLKANIIATYKPIITANAISFSPAVLVSQFTTLRDTIVDTGSVPVRFVGLQTSPSTDFSATSIPPLPATLTPGETLFVTVRFAPDPSVTDSTQTITATLQAVYNDTCTGGTDTIPVQLSGHGYKTGPSPVVLCFGADTTVTFGSVISIPISIDTSISIFDTLAVTIYINYDPMVLRVLGVTSQCGNTTFTADPVKKIITVTLPKCMNSIQQGIIATLQAEVLIGPQSSTTLSIDSAAYTSPYIQNSKCPHNYT
ncbi:MAG TPA: choice-of-anchor D domain-containing protein, partial [Candidatus Kapabacteria bacterium]|nr:choice-of-anchor D domain-containing protein [Candidatus Kapabacteria bacterium]